MFWIKYPWTEISKTPPTGAQQVVRYMQNANLCRHGSFLSMLLQSFSSQMVSDFGALWLKLPFQDDLLPLSARVHSCPQMSHSHKYPSPLAHSNAVLEPESQVSREG